jgi:hypothetical protein
MRYNHFIRLIVVLHLYYSPQARLDLAEPATPRRNERGVNASMIIS